MDSSIGNQPDVSQLQASGDKPNSEQACTHELEQVNRLNEKNWWFSFPPIGTIGRNEWNGLIVQTDTFSCKMPNLTNWADWWKWWSGPIVWNENFCYRMFNPVNWTDWGKWWNMKTMIVHSPWIKCTALCADFWLLVMSEPPPWLLIKQGVVAWLEGDIGEEQWVPDCSLLWHR